MNFEKTLEDLKTLTARKRVLEVRIQGLREDLQAEMAERKLKTVEADGISAGWTSSYMRETFDTKAFQDQYPELYEDFVSAKRVSKRLVIRCE